jgi:hypothetical protein
MAASKPDVLVVNHPVTVVRRAVGLLRNVASNVKFELLAGHRLSFTIEARLLKADSLNWA